MVSSCQTYGSDPNRHMITIWSCLAGCSYLQPQGNFNFTHPAVSLPSLLFWLLAIHSLCHPVLPPPIHLADLHHLAPAAYEMALAKQHFFPPGLHMIFPLLNLGGKASNGNQLPHKGQGRATKSAVRVWTSTGAAESRMIGLGFQGWLWFWTAL